MKYLAPILFLAIGLNSIGQNQAPVISNLDLKPKTNNILEIKYDLADFENDEVNVSLHVKEKEGKTFSIDTENATGDLKNVTPGKDKSIEWDFSNKLTSSGFILLSSLPKIEGL